MNFEDEVNADAVSQAGLEKLGYKQEMTRHVMFVVVASLEVEYRYCSLSWQSVCLSSDLLNIATYPPVAFGISSPIATSLVGGGPAVIIWGWILVSFLTQTLALSLAEICSKYPTSAGTYYWCYRLASPRTRLLASWINGWLTVVGGWTVDLSVKFATTQLVVAGAGIYYSEWSPTTLQTCTHLFVVSEILIVYQIICACWTGVGIITKAAAGRHPVFFALGNFDPSFSGWTPGWSFFIGILPPGKILTNEYVSNNGLGHIHSADTQKPVANMAEEVHNPSKILPKAIISSVPIGSLTGMVFLLPILFTLPDVATLLQVSSGQPIGVMFTLIMGSKAGGFGLVSFNRSLPSGAASLIWRGIQWFIIFGIGMFCSISTSCASSRATWAFARDKAIPFHQLLSKISPHLDDVPVNALLLSTVIQILLGLVYLGSSAAFNAFAGVAVMCLGASNAMPVAILLMNARRDMHDAPFNLGRFGTVINAVAVLWIMFVTVLFSMPAVIPVTRWSMNYASAVFGGFGVISAVWYMISGQFYYRGPPIQEEPTSSSGSSDSASL
ncbi:amino acid transporter [Suillus bovinus]|uniref:amino acid transporter n=1 Tax=Suillus bovinus TaxID=48563 RepID=UPI001B881AF3|nr:amino acid transporter [Suillus bovinus]KAG2145449.1 amino acid transporter [Suillus bovinus]